MANAYVGDRVSPGFVWTDGDGIVATGTATAVLESTNPATGAKEYLQPDFVTLNSTATPHTLTLQDGYRWRLSGGIGFVLPAALAERHLDAIGTHSDVDGNVLARLVVGYDVTENSLDDVADDIVDTPALSEPYRLDFG